MKRLSEADMARIEAILWELRTSYPDDLYLHLMLDELARALEKCTSSPQTTYDGWVTTD